MNAYKTEYQLRSEQTRSRRSATYARERQVKAAMKLYFADNERARLGMQEYTHMDVYVVYQDGHMVVTEYAKNRLGLE
jgi:hypothetical protein